MGTTQLTWDTGSAAAGQVYVVVDGKGEKLFGEGRIGSQSVPWINTGSTYEFRLYAGKEHKKQLAKVKVTRKAK
jgi:hypothetical protein